jgi:curved DNA-binding protein CbpA
MNYKEAFYILEIDIDEVDFKDITLDYLKKKYHKLALQNHPDKNGNTPTSTEKFKRINEAYDFLKRETEYLNHDTFDTKNDDTSTTPLYFEILQMFMRSMMESKYNDIISQLVNDIVMGCKKISLKLFDNLDKDMSVGVYVFLSKYRYILHLDEDILEEIRKIVIQKYGNVEIYKLNPSITDLLNNNVYKLFVDEQLYLVPLWFNELYFDGSGNEIIVLCEPELAENVKIDDDNNIYIEIQYLSQAVNLFETLTNNNDITFNLGDKVFSIQLSNLFMRKEQFYRIKNEGLSKVNDDIYNVTEKADIIVKITFV